MKLVMETGCYKKTCYFLDVWKLNNKYKKERVVLDPVNTGLCVFLAFFLSEVNLYELSGSGVCYYLKLSYKYFQKHNKVTLSLKFKTSPFNSYKVELY